MVPEEKYGNVTMQMSMELDSGKTFGANSVAENWTCLAEEISAGVGCWYLKVAVDADLNKELTYAVFGIEDIDDIGVINAD